MNENVIKFFELYESDEALRQRLEQALAFYPGSLEIREAVVENVLLPVAAELGLPFELNDLRKYETRKKMQRNVKSETEDFDDDGGEDYWLLDRGWTYADSKFEK